MSLSAVLLSASLASCITIHFKNYSTISETKWLFTGKLLTYFASNSLSHLESNLSGEDDFVFLEQTSRCIEKNREGDRGDEVLHAILQVIIGVSFLHSFLKHDAERLQ